ncbi:MAG: hypothetical protein KDC98_05990 [Planctomycetes bacterium]|nr:hypothetical protein [Planctomycetota bacterium]
MTDRSTAILFAAVGGLLVSDLCAQRALTWRRIAPPSPQEAHCFATNVSGNGVVLFDVQGQTWTFDGQAWREHAVAGGPVPRSSSAMVWDVWNQRVVLFGGIANANGQLLQDTWQWNGTTWSELTPPASPARRHQHAMAYDHTRRRVVLCGGADANGVVNDTWELDGGTWTSFGTTAGMTPRRLHAMASNGTSGVVMFGGYYFSGAPQLADTWVRIGTTWVQRNPLLSPPGDRQHGMALHASSQEVVMIGGEVRPNTCWAWDGSNWSPRPARSQAGNRGCKIAYDPARDVTVTFGGALTTGNPTNTVFEWNGASWAQARVSPAARQGAALAFDPVANETMLNGGVGAASSTQFADTWSWNGSVWARQASGQLFRSAHSLDFDPVGQRLLLFGGWNGTTQTADTFAWDRVARQWTNLAPGTVPPARYGHASCGVDHGGMRGVLVFGGWSGNAVLGDAWLFDGSTWNSLTVSNPPAPRVGARMATEPGDASVLLFGGGTTTALFSDTFRFDLATNTFVQLSPTVIPAPRSYHAMRFDPARGSILLVGGLGSAGALSDCYEWDSTAGDWEQLAAAPAARGNHDLALAPGGTTLLFGGVIPNVDVFDTGWVVAPFSRAQFQPIGVGCGMASGPAPVLSSTSPAYIGNLNRLRLSGLPVAALSAFLQYDLTLRSTPYSLCPTCLVYIDGLTTVHVPSFGGTANVSLPIPNVPAFVGMTLYAQGAAFDPSYPCLPGVGVALTNAARIVIGAY